MAVTARPAHRDPRRVALVFVGGATGATLRAGIGAVAATGAGQFPWGTFFANVSGALLLGFLSEVLLGLVRDERRRQSVLLTLGTGLLGGYTTYSSFAVETAALLTTAPWLAVAYAVGSVAAGFAAALAGWALGRTISGRSR